MFSLGGKYRGLEDAKKAPIYILLQNEVLDNRQLKIKQKR